ncbi:MAG: hypothetical protein FJ313_05015, partial [Gemmatimonadetes bacterium]|nr:hypothetical protein [Gemmatimonadota bacterium]
SMAGATFDTATDSLEALRNRGDAAWITATGFSTLSAADVSGAVWNAATATYGAAGSYGLLIETNLDSTISSRAAGATALSNAIWTDAKAGYLTATVPSISQIWGEALPGAYGAGTAGKLLSTAGSAADPWATSVPGAYATGTAGYIFGTINTKLSAATLSTQSLVADDGTATIFRGDDYLEADGRALTFTISNYSGPSLSGGTATLALITKANYDRGLTTSALSVTLTVTGTTTLTCKADLTDTQTAALASNPNQAVTYIYQLRATTKGGSKITLGQGTLVVRPRIAE